MEPHSRLSTKPTHLRFYGDFEIKVNPKSIAGFSTEQLVLLESILATPRVLTHIARMALEIDLCSWTDTHFRNKYTGPSDRDLLNCVLPCLPSSDHAYWESLRQSPDDALHNEITPVFFVFEVELNRTGIEQITAG